MKDIFECAKRVLPEGWEVYTSGGGCYHACKDFDGIGVEISEGGANVYTHDNSEDLASMSEVVENNLFPNFIELGSIYDNGRFGWEGVSSRIRFAHLDEIRRAIIDFTNLHRDSANLKDKFEAFAKAARDLADAWEGVDWEVEEHVEINEDYPFSEDFREVVASIEKWTEK
jgi:hypothetical protein